MSSIVEAFPLVNATVGEFEVAKAAWTPCKVSNDENPEFIPFIDSSISHIQQDLSVPDILYQPLVGENEIRVLAVQPGAFESDIVCALHRCSIGFEYKSNSIATRRRTNYAISLSDGKLLYYTALSYVWGPPTFTSRIKCNDFSKDITPALDLAIRHLRSCDEAVHLWVDQLCINQEDITEKSQQVQIMGTVYSRAFNTILWLGPGPADLAFEILRRVHSKWQYEIDTLRETDYQSLELPCSASEAWRNLDEVFSRPWFRRIWIVQEAVRSAPCSYVMSGSSCTSWESFSTWCITLSNSGLIDHLGRREDVDPGSSNIASGCTITTELGTLETDFRTGGPGGIGQLLPMTRYAQATDPRDKLFAILGISRSEINANYAMPTSAVFRQVTWSILKQEQEHLQRIRMAGHQLESMPLNSVLVVLTCVDHPPEPELRPSWVPDWSQPRHSVSLSFYQGTRSIYKAGTVAPEIAQTLNVNLMRGSKAIQLLGVVFDTIISSLSVAPNVLSYEHGSESFRQLALFARFSAPCHPYPSGDGLFSAFWHTLVAGKDGSGRVSCPSEYSDIMSLLLDESTGKQSSLPDQTYSRRRLQGHFTLDHIKSRSFGRLFQDLRTAYRKATHHRRLCRTRNSYLGLVPSYSDDGDVICVFAGYPVPFVLRSLADGTYRLIGEAYVHGIMSGEAMDMAKSRRIVLV